MDHLIEGPRPAGFLAARLGPVADRDFGCLWLGRSLSLIGDYTFRLAFVTYIISASGSPSTLAAANAALLVPSLVFYLFGGALGDRARSRRRVMIAADLLRFGATATIALAVLRTDSVLAVVLLALLIGIGDGLFQPTSFAFMTEIVPQERLVAANSANSVSQQIGLVVGPLLGGLLVGFGGPALAFGFDAFSFLLSGLLIAAIRTPPRDAAAGDADEALRPGRARLGLLLADIRGGLRYVAAERWLLTSFLIGATANAVFTGNLDVSVPFILSPNGVKGASDLGGFYTLEGVGALVGAVILARLVLRRVGRLLFGMLALMATCLAMVGLFGAHLGSYLMAVVYGVGLHFFNSLYSTVLQEKVPATLLSRVSSFAFLAFSGLMPLGTLVMGPLVETLGAPTAALATGAVVATVCLAATLLHRVGELTIGGTTDR